MTEHQISIKGLVTNYKLFGQGKPFDSAQGKPFLILHGWVSSSSQWKKVGELLAQNNIMAVVPDLPGFGKSQEPNKPWDVDDYVQWAFEFSQKVPELGNGFYLLGHSFGGAVAAKFSVKYNQKVEKLFLAAAAIVREKTIAKNTFARIAKVVNIFSFLPYYKMFRKAVYKFVLQKSDYPHVSGIMKETFIKVVSEDLTYCLPFIKVPTMIIWGDRDKFTPLYQSEIINKKIENSTLVIIPKTGHILEINVPEILAEKIMGNLPGQIKSLP